MTDRPYVGFSRGNTLLESLFARMTGSYQDPWIEEKVFYALLDGKKVNKEVLSKRQWYFVLRRLKQRKLVINKKIGDRLFVRLSDVGYEKQLIASCKKAKPHYPVGQGVHRGI